MSLFEKYIDKEIKNKVKSEITFILRRVLIVTLLLTQGIMNSFGVTFIMFIINSVVICVNIHYCHDKLDFIYYCVSELAVIVFGFITISFTSYNLDIYNKQNIAVIGVAIVVLIYLLLLLLRICEIFRNYRQRTQSVVSFINNT
jgi:hypothetical protein